MADNRPSGTPPAAAAEVSSTGVPQMEDVSAELLVEEVSIDGMCGVY